jgi:glycosyltransferase involved in cell wall biosynthesis
MPSVAILLCTFNGAGFLPAQLSSYTNQVLTDWRIYASDDGSSDDTRALLARFQQHLGSSRMEMRNGPSKGYVANFLSLACDPSISADYYAFSDQDDIWEPQKLSRAVDWLQSVASQIPAAYCSRTRLIDEDGQECGFSPEFRRKPDFKNALVQSIAGGNTMVFNRAAKDLLMAGGPAAHVPSHDWWLYLLITAHGGRVFYDPIPSVRYRVHAKNAIGANDGWSKRLHRLRMLVGGQFQYWNDLNIAALEPFRLRMSPESRRSFELFCDARKRRFFGRLIAFLRAGVYRQTKLGNFGLVLAICTKRF